MGKQVQQTFEFQKEEKKPEPVRIAVPQEKTDWYSKKCIEKAIKGGW